MLHFSNARILIAKPVLTLRNTRAILVCGSIRYGRAIMYLAIGFLVSMLFGLMIVPLVHTRACG